LPARTRDLAHAGLEPPSRPIRASPAARSASATSLAPGEHSGPRACSGGKLPWEFIRANHPTPNPQPSHPPRCNPHPPASRWLVWTHCTAGNRSVDLCYRNGDARVHANRAHRSMLMRGASQSPLRCSLPCAGVPPHIARRVDCADGLPRAGVPSMVPNVCRSVHCSDGHPRAGQGHQILAARQLTRAASHRQMVCVAWWSPLCLAHFACTC
jgi:hypothetical protein